MGNKENNQNSNVFAAKTAPKKKSVKKPLSKNNKNAILYSCIILGILLISTALIIISSSGILLRSVVAVKSDNYTVNNMMMTYFYRLQYNSFMTQYGSYASSFGIDTSKSMKLQECPYLDEESGSTWFDYFMNSAESQVEQLLIFCEEAKKENISLDADDKEEINDAIDTLRTFAKENNYTLAAYIKAIYGTSMRESDVRDCLELSQLASKFGEIENDRLDAAITEDRITKYYDDNPTKFIFADLLAYDFTAKLSSTDSSKATDEEKAAYEADKTKAKENAAALAECKTEKEFKTYIVSHLFDEGFKAEYDDLIDEIEESKRSDATALEALKATMKAEIISIVVDGAEDKITDSTDDDEDNLTEADVLKDVEEALIKTTKDAITTATKNDYAHNTTEDLGKWVFGDTKPAALATNKFESTVSSEAGVETSFTAKAAIIIEPAKRNEEVTKSIGQIVFTPDSFAEEGDETDATTKENAAADARAKAKAEEILAQFKAGTMNRDTFETLAKEWTADSAVFYEDVKSSDNYVEEFLDWMFDDARKEGDVDIIETTYGYHIMYFLGDGDIAWHKDAHDYIYEEDYEAWYKAKTEAYKISFNADAVAKIEG